MRSLTEAGRARDRARLVAPRGVHRAGRRGGFERLVVVLSLVGTASVVRAQADAVYSRTALSSDSAAAAPLPGKAVLFLVRELSPRVGALPDEAVLVDGEAAGVLQQQTWLAVPVDSGRHVVWGVHQGHDLVFECRPGRRYLLRLREWLDDRDQVVRDWLRDDAGGLEALIGRYGLRHATTTPNGFTWIADQRKHLALSAAPGAEDPGRVGPASRVFEHLFSERPLDRINLETDFSQLSGRLVIDSAGVHYRLRERVWASFTSWVVVSDSLDVQISQLVRIRCGGTRFTGTTPWVDLVYRAPQGLRIASFGDADERIAVATCNTLFAVLEDLFAERPRAEADAAGAPH